MLLGPRRTTLALAALLALTLPGAAPAATAPAPAARPAAAQPALAQLAAPRTTANPGNPLAGHPWGVYLGPQEQAWAPWLHATGTRKDLLAKIALRPKAKWFGAWTGNARQIGQKVHDYIDAATHGDPDVLV